MDFACGFCTDELLTWKWSDGLIFDIIKELLN